MTDWRKLLTDEHLWDYRCKAVPVPLVREIVEEVETLRQDLAAARAERDAAFKMSRCECSADECCSNLVRLHNDLAAARAECEEQARLNGMGAERELKLQTDLAAARAESDMAHWLLRNARKYMNPMHEALCAAIDNALQKKQAAIVMERSEVAGEDLAVPSGGLEGGPEEERIEAAYWRFDARHKGYGQWKNAPMSERDAFKAEMRNALGAEKTRAEMRLVASGWRKPAALSGERREGE